MRHSAASQAVSKSPAPNQCLPDHGDLVAAPAAIAKQIFSASEVFRLIDEMQKMRREAQDLQIALLTANEHGDLLQEHLYGLSKSLAAEVRERQAAEHKLQTLVQAVTQEKADLEILVQILVDQGDHSAEEGQKARIDGLTKIANRRRFDECLAQEWERHLLAQAPLALLVCDVDHFKLYNDLYGHQAGDDCLIRVVNAISQSVRVGDLVARYGGEEFAVVLPRTSHDAGIRVAERARVAVADAGLPHAASSLAGRLTVSVGVGCVTPCAGQAANPRGLIDEADRNLYLAKNRGRNRVEPSGRM